MNLELRSIISPGNLDKERLTLRALADLDVGDYIVAQATFVGEALTTSLIHTFWFPFKQIKKGDLVVVYTKIGNKSEKVLQKGNRAHFFYLDLDKSIWNSKDVGAVVLHAPWWNSANVSELINN